MLKCILILREEQKQRRILRDFGAQPISQPQQQPLQSNIAMSSFRNNLGQSTMEPAFRESQPSGYARFFGFHSCNKFFPIISLKFQTSQEKFRIFMSFSSAIR